MPLSASFSSYQHKKGTITVGCGAKYNFSNSLLRFDFEFEASGLLQTDLLPLHIQNTLTGSNTCSICGLIHHNNVVFRTEMLMQSYCTTCAHPAMNNRSARRMNLHTSCMIYIVMVFLDHSRCFQVCVCMSCACLTPKVQTSWCYTLTLSS